MKTRNLVKQLVILIFAFFVQKTLHAQQAANGAEHLNLKDSAKIRTEVIATLKSIFDAFVNSDSATLAKTHSTDWVGFAQFAPNIRKGIDQYMQPIRNWRNGKSAMAGYTIDNYNLEIFDDVVLLYYEATITTNINNNNAQSGLRSLDVYQKRNGQWVQIGSHISPKLSQDQVRMLLSSNSKG